MAYKLQVSNEADFICCAVSWLEETMFKDKVIALDIDLEDLRVILYGEAKETENFRNTLNSFLIGFHDEINAWKYYGE